MNPHLFLAYCFAVAILVLIPGPIVTLVVANSLSHGSRSGLATVAGASIGNAILLGATAVGLVAFFERLPNRDCAGIVGLIGGVVCTAAAIAGATSQDLKTGYLVGSTPFRQQMADRKSVV